MLTGFPLPGKYKVLIRCNTFNQSKYIEDSLRGFAEQRTNFPFLTYVIDDASTDGEQEVLRRWIIEHCKVQDIAIYDTALAVILMSVDKVNPNCFYAIHLLKKNLYQKKEKQTIHNYWREQCEYEALCEGDDFWIDPLKLQKQIDLLENNKDCILCYHAYESKIEEGSYYRKCNRGQHVKTEYAFSEIAGNYLFQTATVIFRQELNNNEVYKKISSFGLRCGDRLLFLAASNMGRVCGINERMSVYRLHPGGITNNAQYSKISVDYLRKWICVADSFPYKKKRILYKQYIIYIVLGICSYKNRGISIHDKCSVFINVFRSNPLIIKDVCSYLLFQKRDTSYIAIK